MTAEEQPPRKPATRQVEMLRFGAYADHVTKDRQIMKITLPAEPWRVE
jgi:hypothetical protein